MKCFDLVLASCEVRPEDVQNKKRCSRCGDRLAVGRPVVLVMYGDMEGNTLDPTPLAAWCVICVGLKANNYQRIARALSRKDWQTAAEEEGAYAIPGVSE